MKIKLIENSQKVDITSSPEYKLKPTLREPTPMGQKVDNEYKKQTSLKQNNVNVSEVTDAMLSEDEKTRKKKIFKLSKMESLVHNDDKLSRIYAKIIQDDPEVKFGYHYNETVMNMLFNDYVLNNPQYMEKYKNAVPKKKKRRDKTGINQLIKKGEENMDKKIDTNNTPEKINNDLDQEVNEIFGSLFGGGFDVNKFERKPDQVQPNDLFVFDSNSKKLIDIIPREKIQDFRRKYNDLFNQELVKIASPKNDIEVKNLKLLYKLPDIKFASEFNPLGESEYDSVISSDKYKLILNKVISVLKTLGADNRLIKQVELSNSNSPAFDFISKLIKSKAFNGNDSNEIAKSLIGVWDSKFGKTNETTGSASSGAFSAPLGMEIDKKIEETTTSASSGQYSTPVAFSKNPKKGRFFNKPIWNGGIVIGEGVDYITNPEAFKKYALMVESYNEIEEAIGDLEKYIDSGDKTSYIKTLTNLFNMYKQKINVFGDEYKEHYNNLIKDISDEIAIAKQEQAEFEKKQSGINENPDYAGGIKADLIGSGKPASEVNKMSTRELENEDGLFKGGIDEHHLQTKEDKINFIIQNDEEGVYDVNSLDGLSDQEIDQIYSDLETAMGLSEKAKSKAQQRFMGMVHALQKGDIDSSDVSSKVQKAADDMSYSDAEDFAATKHNDLPDHVSTDESFDAVDSLTELGNLLFPNTDMSIEQLKSAAQDILQKFFKNQTPEQAVELLRAKMATTGQMAEEIINSLNKNIMQENYKSVISKRLTESRDAKKVKSVKEMNNEERLAQFKAIYESMIDQNPTTMAMSANNPTSMKNDSEDQVGDQPFPEINENPVNVDSFDVKISPERFNAYLKQVLMQLRYYGVNDKLIRQIENLTPDADDDFTGTIKWLMSNGEEPKRAATIIKNKWYGQDLNEDRKSNSMLNLERIKAQNASNTKSDNAKEDALSSEKTYGFSDKNNDIHKSSIYPNPDDFYIEQDFDKVQDDMTSFEEIEKEKLAQGGFKKDALENVGDAVREKDYIPKRNATEEEQKKIMLNRGAGMEDIVYDNKPAKKFDDRMKQDMGDQVYKNRQEKMNFKADAPMYNKDTQPVQDGGEKFFDNKYEKKYNTESVTAVYVDQFGKRKFKDFNINEAIDISNIDESFIKLDLDGFGNLYTQKVKVNESIAQNIKECSYYIKENKIYKVKKEESKSLNESLNKLKHLINYNPAKFVGK